MNRKRSIKDKNDKLMFSAGFIRHPKMDGPEFNTCGKITYWTLPDDHNFLLITSKDDKMTMKQLLDRVMYRTRYQTYREFEDAVISTFRKLKYRTRYQTYRKFVDAVISTFRKLNPS